MKDLKIFLIIFGILIKSSVKTSLEVSESDINNFDVFWNGFSKDEVRFKQSEIMQNYLNINVDPCENFFEYACGNWLKYNYQDYHQSNEDQRRYSNLLAGIKSFIRSLNEYNSETNFDQAISAEEKMKIYYSSCINESQKEVTDFTEFLKVIEPYGGSPLWNQNWKSENFDWVKLETFGVITNIPIFFHRSFHKNQYSTFYLNDRLKSSRNVDQTQKYKELIQNILKLTGISEKLANETSNEIVQFENELQEIFSKFPRYINKIIVIDYLIKNFQNNDWRNYFVNVNVSNFGDTMLMPKETEEMIEFISTQRPEIVANFMIWQILKSKLNLFDVRYRNELEKYQKSLNEFPQESLNIESIHSECFNDIKQILHLIPVATFFDKHFKFNEENFNEIINEIKETLKIFLSESNLIGKNIKQNSFEYLNNLLTYIKYPEPNSIDIINKIYENLEISSNKYFENWFNASEFEHKRHLKQKFIEIKWIYPRSDLYRYEYLTNSKTLSIPVSNLQPSNFHLNFPNSLNLGGVGVFLVNNIINGLPFIKRYNKKWTEKAEENIVCLAEERLYYVKTILKEYNSVKVAFEIFRNKFRNSKNIVDEQLPGFDMSSEKLFFINYAQNRCSFKNNQTDNFEMKILQNFQRFGDSFSCPIGSYMNPEIKCNLSF